MSSDVPGDSADAPVESHSSEAAPPAVEAGAGLFPLVAAAGGVFCLSVFVYVAAAFGSAEAPVNQWINRHGTTVILVEVLILMLVCGAAMTVDRIRTLRLLDERKADAETSTPPATHDRPGSGENN